MVRKKQKIKKSRIFKITKTTLTSLMFVSSINNSFFYVNANESATETLENAINDATIGNNTNTLEHVLRERAATSDEVASSINIIDFTDLTSYPGKNKDKIMIFFDGQSGYFKLKDGQNDMSKLTSFKFPFARNKRNKPHPVRGKDLNQHNGIWHGTHWRKVDKTHMLFYADDPGKNDAGQTNEPGQYSGKIRFEYAQGRGTRDTDYNLYIYYLKFDNTNSSISRYIDEEIPQKEELLKNIRLEITAKKPEDKREQEEMLNTLMETHKKIVAYQVDGSNRVSLSENFTTQELPRGKEFTLILELTNPTKTKQKNGDDQKIEYRVRMLFVDTKTPLIQKIEQQVQEVKDKISNTNGLTSEEINELNNEIDNNKNQAIDRINDTNLKHADLHTEPFRGSEAEKTQAKQNAEKNIKSIKDPLDLAIEKNLQIADFIVNAKNQKAKIDQNNLYTDDEKKLLKEKADQQLEKAKQEIKSANSLEDLKNKVEALKKEFTETVQLDSDPAKKTAQTSFEEMVNSKKQTINSQHPNLLDDERQKVLDKIDEAHNKANEALKTATNQPQIDQIKETLKNELEAIKFEGSSAKDEAISEINRVAQEKIDALNNNKDLIKEEKDQVIANINKAKQDALNAINTEAFTSVDQLNTRKNALIENIKTASIANATKKTESKNTIDTYLQAKISEIDNNDKLSNQEKEKYKKQVQDLVKHVKEQIDDADNLDESTLNQKVNNLKSSLDNMVLLGKDKVLEELQTAYNAKKQDIDNNKHLTNEEKESLNNELKNIFDSAKNNINQQNNQVDIDHAKTSSLNDINSFDVSSKAKEKAKSDIDKLAQERNRAIDSNDNLSQIEKEKYKKEVNDIAVAKKNEIDAKENPVQNDLDLIVTENENLINAIMPIGKEKAIKAIEDEARLKIQAVNSNNNLTDEEKTKLEENINNLASKAIENITKSIGNQDDINALKDHTVNSIKAISTESVVKTKAIKEINDAYNEKLNLIDQASPSLTNEEKAKVQKDLDDAKNQALNSINKANTDALVASAQENGVNAIKEIKIESDIKNNAKKELEQKVTEKIAEINENKALTTDEQKILIDQVKEEYEQAKALVDSSVTNDNVNQAKESGLKAIVNTNHQGTKKKEMAINALRDKVAEKISQINDDKSLTSEEKSKLIEQVDSSFKNAETSIVASQLSNNDLETKKNEAINNIFKIQHAGNKKKEEAKKDFNQQVQHKIQSIEADHSLTTEEKDALKNEVNALVTVTNKAIEEASNNTEVDTNKQEGIAKLASISHTGPKLKDSAIQALKSKVAERLEELKNDNSLTSEEKTDLTSKINEALLLAENAINNSQTNDNVTSEKEKGLKAINEINIVEENKVKVIAKKELEEAVAKKLETINSDNTLTTDEKEVLKSQITEGLIKTNKAIEDASNNDDVDTNKQAGLTVIDAIKHNGDKKKDLAKKELTEKSQEKIAEIKANITLTTNEQNALIDQVKRELETAKNNIDSVDTNDKVNQAKETGLTNIRNINHEGDKKKELAIKDLEAKVAEKIDVINKDNSLTSEEKNALFTNINNTFNSAKNDISNNKLSNDELENKKNQAIQDIQAIKHEGSKQKDLAKQSIQEVVTKKLETINSDNTLTTEEKEALKSQVNSLLQSAKQEIQDADTNDKVSELKNSNLEKIANVYKAQETRNKYQTKQSLENEANNKIKQINDDVSLTQDEKDLLVNEVKEILKQDKDSIDSKETDQEVKDTKLEFINKINSINLLETEKAKTKAINDIKDKYNVKVKEITDNQDLSETEKELYRSELASILSSATESINKDQNITNNDLSELKNGFIKDINSVTPLAKEKAQNAIDEALNAKYLSIDNNKTLTKEEKDTLKNTLNELASKAKNDIVDFGTQDKINTLRDKTVKAISESEEKGEAKTNAIAKIEGLANKKLDEIKKHPLLSDREKELNTKQVNDSLNSAKEKIEKAANITQDELNHIVQEEERRFAMLDLVAEDKPIFDIEAYLNTKLANLENDKILTDDEKASIKSKANEILNKARSDIRAIKVQAINNKQETINKLSLDAIEELKKLDVTPKVRPNALIRLQAMFNDKLASINTDNTLTIEEKTLLGNQVNELREKAIKDLDILNTNTSINQLIEDTNTKLALIRIEDKDKVKEIAKAKIIAEAKRLEESIYSNQDISSKETYALLAILHQNKLDALKAIDEAKDNATVNSIKLKPVHYALTNSKQNKPVNTILPNTGHKHTLGYSVPLLIAGLFGLFKKTKKKDND